jgi:hypothetical protein
MLTLERIRRELLNLPMLTRIGLLILVIGGIADVVAHLEVSSHIGHTHEHPASELTAHLIGFVGMAVILLGIVLDGTRRTRRSRSGGDRIAPTSGPSTPRTSGRRTGALPGGTRHG